MHTTWFFSIYWNYCHCILYIYTLEIEKQSWSAKLNSSLSCFSSQTRYLPFYTYFTTSSLLFLTFARSAFLSDCDLYHSGKSITLAKSYCERLRISSIWCGSNHSIGQLSISICAQVSIRNPDAIYTWLVNRLMMSSSSLPEINHLARFSYPTNASRSTPLVLMILSIYAFTCSEGSLVSLHNTSTWLQSTICDWWKQWGKRASFTDWSETTTRPRHSTPRLLGA